VPSLFGGEFNVWNWYSLIDITWYKNRSLTLKQVWALPSGIDLIRAVLQVKALVKISGKRSIPKEKPGSSW